MIKRILYVMMIGWFITFILAAFSIIFSVGFYVAWNLVLLPIMPDNTPKLQTDFAFALGMCITLVLAIYRLYKTGT